MCNYHILSIHKFNIVLKCAVYARCAPFFAHWQAIVPAALGHWTDQLYYIVCILSIGAKAREEIAPFGSRAGFVFRSVFIVVIRELCQPVAGASASGEAAEHEARHRQGVPQAKVNYNWSYQCQTRCRVRKQHTIYRREYNNTTKKLCTFSYVLTFLRRNAKLLTDWADQSLHR